MANHGYCKNCWWWWHVKFTMLPPLSREIGECYFQDPNGKHKTFADSYCPDYINRDKENKNKTLSQYLAQQI